MFQPHSAIGFLTLNTLNRRLSRTLSDSWSSRCIEISDVNEKRSCWLDPLLGSTLIVYYNQKHGQFHRCYCHKWARACQNPPPIFVRDHSGRPLANISNHMPSLGLVNFILHIRSQRIFSPFPPEWRGVVNLTFQVYKHLSLRSCQLLSDGLDNHMVRRRRPV